MLHIKYSNYKILRLLKTKENCANLIYSEVNKTTFYLSDEVLTQTL